MPSPVLPADFKALIPDPNATLCGNFIKALIQLPTLIYKWFAWAFDSSGNPSKALVNSSLKTGSLLFSACTQTEDGTILLCDGRQVSQTTYPDLYAAIGATYGTASAGNFKLPNYQAKFPVGIGTFAAAGTVSLGTAGGEDQHKLTLAELPAAASSISPATGLWARKSGTGTTSLTSAAGSQDGLITLPAGSDTPHNNIPPFLGCYIYIVL